MNIIKEAAQQVMKKAVELAPDAWMPGGKSDPLLDHREGYIGMPVSRLDGADKVQGRAPFAAEFPLEGLAYAALVYSTVPKGRIATLDTAAAESAPGVVLVMTHKNAPPMKPMPLFLTAEKAAAGEGLPVFQDDSVHYNGQPVALVLAATQEQADHATSLIRVTYLTETAVTSLEAAKAKGSEPGAFMGDDGARDPEQHEHRPLVHCVARRIGKDGRQRAQRKKAQRASPYRGRHRLQCVCHRTPRERDRKRGQEDGQLDAALPVVAVRPQEIDGQSQDDGARETRCGEHRTVAAEHRMHCHDPAPARLKIKSRPKAAWRSL